MERLTYDFCIGGNHYWKVKGTDNLECREVCERQEESGCKTCPIANAFDRLAAYENTGLEPQEIKSLQAEWQANLKVLESYRELGVPVDRLRELVEAGRGGRCVVLPCKVGDTIYDISLAEIKESKVVSISFSASELPYHVSICAENYNYAVTIDIEMNDFIEIDDFGKIVFFTREEAEAALRRGRND